MWDEIIFLNDNFVKRDMVFILEIFTEYIKINHKLLKLLSLFLIKPVLDTE